MAYFGRDLCVRVEVKAIQLLTMKQNSTLHTSQVIQRNIQTDPVALCWYSNSCQNDTKYSDELPKRF